MHPHHPVHPFNGNGNHHLHGLGNQEESGASMIAIMVVFGLLVFFTTPGGK